RLCLEPSCFRLPHLHVARLSIILSSRLPPPPSSPLLPYTTLFRSQFSAELGMLPPDDVTRIERHLAAVGLPTHLQDIAGFAQERSEEHTSELQSRFDLVCRLLLEKKKR